MFKNPHAEDNFACMLCFNILNSPVECDACHEAYCKKCIQDWGK